MRGALFGSGLAHAAILIALFAVRVAAPVVVPGPDVVQVSLMDPSAMQTVAAPPPVERAEMQVPDLKPTEPEGVKLAPEKKPPRKPEKKREESAPAPASVPTLPFAPVGNAGLSGEVGVDSRDFEFTYYLMLVRNRVAQNWTPPAGVTGQGVQATVHFRIARDGSVSAVQLESASGVDFFDRSALRAVTLSDPLPPLPLGFPGPDLGVHFGFRYARP